MEQVNKKLEEKRKELSAPEQPAKYTPYADVMIVFHPFCPCFSSSIRSKFSRISTLTDERFAIAPSTEDCKSYTVLLHMSLPRGTLWQKIAKGP